MFSSTAGRLKTVAALSLAGALTVGGVAVAQPGGGSTHHARNATQTGQPHGKRGKGGGPSPLGIPIPGFSYAEVHVNHEGKSQVIEIDEGKIVSVSESEIVLSENGGSEVSVPLSASTTVRGRPGTQTSVSDLKEGELVIVCGPQGGEAKTVLIVPKRGEGGQRAGGPQGPPTSGPESEGEGETEGA